MNMFFCRSFALLCIASLACTLALEDDPTCKDTELKFVMRGKNKDGGPRKKKDCDWVKSKNKDKLCGKSKYAKFCPILCDKPKLCKFDVTEKFEVSHTKKEKTKIKFKTCVWASKKWKERCGKEGVADVCRATCSAFPAPSSMPSVSPLDSPSLLPSVSDSPSDSPSGIPSDSPSDSPSLLPSSFSCSASWTPLARDPDATLLLQGKFANHNNVAGEVDLGFDFK